MSTFDGIVQEFPYIQIDYFRKNPDRPLPLACFLSHVHSDHLQGLESFRAPFIYCSAATREMLLRIEKYPHRMNFNKGILESRKLHYKHLSKLLRPIPMNTPTEIELTPRLSIRVTLLDANHCTGAVMFLIEGNGKAILYTGDIRAESWWVNSLVRHPVLLPYTLGNKRLDKIYLDTTFARSSKIYHSFPSKAEGLSELLRRVEQYPNDTIFYFRAWTFGYEEVWIALSAALNTKIHVDRYQMGLYRPLRTHAVNEAPSLCGFELGNKFIPGCLSDDENARIHSCEPGVPCSVAESKKVVEILPIVTRSRDGAEVPEVGVGGGGGDLYQIHELLLPDQYSLEELEKLCSERIQDARALSQTREVLIEAFKSKSRTLKLDSYGLKDDTDIPLNELVTILSHGRGHSKEKPLSKPAAQKISDHQLPNIIHFPYSRHSSYMELCELVAAFRPKDIHPCTVDPLTWTEEISMQSLFGHLCSGDTFSHDEYMRETIENDETLNRSRKRARLHGEFSSQLSESQLIETQSQSQSQLSISFHQTEPEAILSSSSSRTPIPLPSSMDTIPSQQPQPEPLYIHSSSPNTQHSKRSEISHARSYLDSHDAPIVLGVGPLPSSWSPEEDGRFSVTEESDQNKIKDNMQVDVEVEIHNVKDDDNEEDTQTFNQESQISNTLSVPESVFVSDDHETEEEEDVSTPTINPRPSLARSSSSRRKAAYLAARADSYDAWTSISLTSAGNNHTEEEIEL